MAEILKKPTETLSDAFLRWSLHFNENLDLTFDGEMTIGRAKYTAMSYYEDRLEKDIAEFEDELHAYYSQL